MGSRVDEVGVVPPAFADSVADGCFGAVEGLEDTSGDVCGGVIFPGPDQVFAERDIKHPVEIVFDCPVASGDIDQLARLEPTRHHKQAVTGAFSR